MFGKTCSTLSTEATKIIHTEFQRKELFLENRKIVKLSGEYSLEILLTVVLKPGSQSVVSKGQGAVLMAYGYYS